MELDNKILNKLNEQIAHELFNEHFYWACASYFDEIGLSNIAMYFRLHAAEEKTHAEDFYDFINANGGKAIIPEVKKPMCDFKNIVHPFELAMVAEKDTSKQIRELSKLASELQDFRTLEIARKYELEQQEEEDLWSYNLKRAKLAEKDDGALLILDHEMAQRKAFGNKKYKPCK